jgi:hypothetical protein
MMTVKLKLLVPGALHHQEWWIKFCSHLMRDNEPYWNLIERRWVELAKYGGTIHNDGYRIEFKNDADATAFLLRWS